MARLAPDGFFTNFIDKKNSNSAVSLKKSMIIFISLFYIDTTFLRKCIVDFDPEIGGAFILLSDDYWKATVQNGGSRHHEVPPFQKTTSNGLVVLELEAPPISECKKLPSIQYVVSVGRNSY